MSLAKYSPGLDLALLKAPKGGPPLALAPKTPAPGAAVFTIGNDPHCSATPGDASVRHMPSGWRAFSRG